MQEKSPGPASRICLMCGGVTEQQQQQGQQRFFFILLIDSDRKNLKFDV